MTPNPNWSDAAITQYYIDKAHQMRSDAMKSMVKAGGAKLRALFSRTPTSDAATTDTAVA